MILSDEEKIQKAEEIYYRRNGIDYRGEKREKSNGTKRHLLRKFIFVILIVACIYAYQNQEYLMSEDFKTQAKTFLNTKIDIQNLIKGSENEVEEQEIIEETTENEEEKTETGYDVIWPYTGTITSGFGSRESSDDRVTENHTGIDIAGTEGDDIVSAISGTVELVSEEGDLGKHIKISNEQYTTVYAHCSEISVQEGETINQGEIIGKIGSTGNSTGAHLHFEVLANGEYIDPETVIEK